MKALVVDDDVVSRMALVDLMQSFPKLEVVEASDGEEAWQMLEAGLTPVICCSDVQMPKVSGIDLLQRVRSKPSFKEMPFVLITSSADLDTVKKAISLGTSHYIVKPFNATEARMNVDRILSKVWERLAENPSLTLRRLNIAPERLMTYFVSFQKQIAVASNELQALLAANNAQGYKAKVDTLHTGCVTLGMWHASNVINRLRDGRPTPQFLQQTLADVAEQGEAQLNKARALIGARV
jgi:two-component system chemotaxis response regulator CheY